MLAACIRACMQGTVHVLRFGNVEAKEELWKSRQRHKNRLRIKNHCNCKQKVHTATINAKTARPTARPFLQSLSITRISYNVIQQYDTMHSISYSMACHDTIWYDMLCYHIAPCHIICCDIYSNSITIQLKICIVMVLSGVTDIICNLIVEYSLNHTISTL